MSVCAYARECRFDVFKCTYSGTCVFTCVSLFAFTPVCAIAIDGSIR